MSNFNDYLVDSLAYLPDHRLKESMEYALFNSGKQLRPKLLFTLGEFYKLDEASLYPLASAIEMIHTYSLVHDDLPAMDNDSMRRGKPTVHVAYGEDMAILCGDALLSEAFKQLALYQGSNLALILKAFSDAIGANGMVYGQALDICNLSSDTDLLQLQAIHQSKTGRLIALPLELAALAANEVELAQTWQTIGLKIGLAFQIQDDILDVTSDSQTLGKTIGKDALLDKATYISLLGLEDAKAKAEQLIKEANELLSLVQCDYEPLLSLFDKLINRSK